MRSRQTARSCRSRCHEAELAAHRDVLLQLLALDQIGLGVSAAELHAHLGSLPFEAIAAALPSLERSHLVELRDGRLYASRALRHLDRLGLLTF
jgi:hypothetical protein